MRACPVCGNDTLVLDAGCETCVYCGYSKCEVSYDREFDGFRISKGTEEKEDSN